MKQGRCWYFELVALQVSCSLFGGHLAALERPPHHRLPLHLFFLLSFSFSLTCRGPWSLGGLGGPPRASTTLRWPPPASLSLSLLSFFSSLVLSFPCLFRPSTIQYGNILTCTIDQLAWSPVPS